MDQKERQRTQLECLYEMFRDRVEENVIYIVYTENEGKLEETIDYLMSISACSLTGHLFEPTRSSPNDSEIESSIRLRQCSEQDSATGDRNSPSTATEISPTIDENEFKPVRRSKRFSSNQGKLRKNASPCQSSCGSRSKQEQPPNSCDAESSVGTGDTNEQESLEDEEFPVENADRDEVDLDEQIKNLHASIETLLSEKGSCHDKASHYLNKKMFPVTSYYSELANQYRRSIEAKTKELVDLLLMKSENENTIDLHGLNPIQAKLIVSQLLNSRRDKLCIDKQGEATVDIITGWGKHTVTEGNHRIRPTIVALLREKGYEFYHLNRGALRVTIRR